MMARAHKMDVGENMARKQAGTLPELQALAQAAAERFGLAYEYRFTGYGDLQRSLAFVATQSVTV